MAFTWSDLDPTMKDSPLRKGLDVVMPINPFRAYDALKSIAGGNKNAQPTLDQQKAPWSAQQPYLQDLFRQSQALYNQGGELYPGFGPATQQAMGMVQDLAGNNQLIQNAGSNLNSLMAGGYNPAMGLNMPTAMGGFLNSNPYLDATFNQAAGQVANQFKNAVAPSIQGKFGLAGGFNRPGEQQALGQARTDLGNTLGNLATSIYGGNYANERGLMQGAIGNIGQLYNQGQQTQLGALGLAPQINQAQYYGAGQLANIGAQQDELARQRAMEPWTRLQMYGQNVTGNFTSPAQVQPPKSNTLGGLLGAGIGLLTPGGGPLGAGIGYQIGSSL